ncbi:MAG: hypothetical protein M1818_005684 [Claussenomyces sp. TS43310]|nr:MAG: hypothetical protein M1818_005684 [Claussenomyces sp. TS43310]
MSTTTKLASSPSKAAHVIVVGSGSAGLSAASQLVDRGVAVHLLERSAKTGGNSIKASSGINGAGTKFQSVPDTSFYDDTVRSAGAALASAARQEPRQKLIETLTNSSKSAVYWLVDDKGVDLSRVAQLGAHSVPRTHRGSGQTPPGAAIITTLMNSLKSNPLFRVDTGCLVTKVLQSENEVVGVEYTSEGETKADQGPVIFASGGFAGDANGMLAQYRPDLAGFPSTNEAREGSQKLLTNVGAQLLDMDLVQVHPTSFVDPKDALNPAKFLAGELLRGEGGILLLNGKRFVNEMESRKYVTNVIVGTPQVDASPRQWDVQLVLDEDTHKRVADHVGFYVWKGLMHKTTVAELGPSALSSLQEYAEIATGRTPDPFGRKSFGHWSLSDVKPDSVIYTGRVTPATHFTMGGVTINEHSEVLNAEAKPIKGLWAAGEISGGIHGDNRLGGSSLLECVVFGRIAGDQAAEYLSRQA